MTEHEFGHEDQGSGTERGAMRSGAQALLGPLTLRDVVVLASVLVMFIGSLLPIFRGPSAPNLWNGASLFFVGIGILLPLVVAALFLARRLSPKTGPAGLRVGSLSVDQFASVVAAFATAFFFLSTVSGYALGFLVALIGSLGLLAATVAAPLLPFFAADFAGRPEAPAHPAAREAVPAQPRLAARKPAARKSDAAKAGGAREPGGPAAAQRPGDSGGATVSPAAWGEQPPSYQQPASAPELDQFLGTAAAGGGVTAAAASLPAEEQAAWGNQDGAGLPAEAARRDALGHSESAAGYDSNTAEETTLHPSGPEKSAPESGAEAAAGLAAEDGGGQETAGPEGAAYGHPEPEIPEAGVQEAGHEHGGYGPAASGLSDVEEGAQMPAPPEPADHEPAGHEPWASAAAPEQAAPSSPTGQPATAIHETVRARPESIGATVDPAARQQRATQDHGAAAGSADYDAFWFAVDRPRAVVDEKTGGFLYNVQPGNWILALQDRGHDFLVQNTDGRVGVLRDLSNIERAPEGE
ncbi:MAG: hypothetical protein M3017_03315 [Actinomycetota bacterium]|nr:hypothetical protein [Actinomycetota bacterium]